MTEVVTAIATNLGGGAAMVPALIIDLMLAGLFVGFGVYANRKSSVAFVAGMLVYAVDAVLLVFFQDWFSVAFHGLALYYLYRGFSAAGELKSLPEV